MARKPSPRKPKTRKAAALYFNELAAIRDNDVVLAGHLYSLEHEDDPFTRMMICRDGATWNQLGEFDDIVTSVVAYMNDAGRAVVVAMGRSGESLVIDSTGRRISVIPADPGFMFQMFRIGTDLYACGSQRQVWRSRDGAWERMDAGLVVARTDTDNPILHAIHGVSPGAIYAGGSFGELFKYDGARWTQLRSPTTETIQRIHVVSDTEVYLCGGGGTFLRGHDDEWTSLGDASRRDTFTGLAAFRGEVMVSSLNLLFAYDGSALRQIDRPAEPFSFHRLSASPKYLWATGGDGTVARWDGSTWERFLCPDNA